MAIENVLTIFVDTLRARNVGFYGADSNTTPFLDRLATGSTIFENAICTRSGSWMSYTTFFQGDHKFSFPLTDAKEFETQFIENHEYRTQYKQTHIEETLPGKLSEADVPAIAVVSGSMLSSSWGWDRGFDVFDDDFHSRLQKATIKTQIGSSLYRYASVGERKLHQKLRLANNLDSPRIPAYGSRRAEQTTDTAIEHLDDLTNEDGWFYFLQYTDPHAPNYPYQGAPRMWSLYNQDIRRVDDSLERLYEYLEKNDILETTLVIITGDHGESFIGEHNVPYRDHGLNVFDESVRVPMLLSHPDLPAQRVRNGVARIKDLAPTILDVFNLESPSHFTGESLLPVARGESSPPKEAFIVERGDLMVQHNSNASYETVGPVVALRTSSSKYITTPALDEPLEWWYDLEIDPREQSNRAKNREITDMSNSLQVAIEEWESKRDTKRFEQQNEDDREMREQLRDLGYL